MHIVGIFDVRKLREICDPFSESSKQSFGDRDKYNPWSMDVCLDKTILKDFIKNKIESTLHEGSGFSSDEIKKAYHYARIAHFVNHGWNDSISLKFGNIGDCDYWPGWTVINGNHRYCAALYLEEKRVPGKIVNMPKDFDYKYFLD